MTATDFDTCARQAFDAATRADTTRTRADREAAATACSMAMTAATFAGRQDAMKAFATMAQEQMDMATAMAG